MTASKFFLTAPSRHGAKAHDAASGNHEHATVPLRFRLKDGSVKHIPAARIGQSILDVAHEHDIDLEGMNR
jgi:hypothetical protein